MAELPTLYVCHGDDEGPRIHPCRRVQEALREAGIEYEKVIAAHGSPIPFLRKGSREELQKATGTNKLPTLKLRRDSGQQLPRDPALGRTPKRSRRSHPIARTRHIAWYGRSRCALERAVDPLADRSQCGGIDV